MASVSYAYAVGNVRAHEASLLSRQDLEQLLAQKTPEMLASALRDKGYGDAAGDEDGELLIRKETEAMWSYLRSITPDFALYDPFLFRNDYHNLKAILKGTISGRPYKHLLLYPSTVETDILTKAVKERRFDLLPAHMKAAADGAYDAIAHAYDAQLCDLLLDRAAMEAMLCAAQRIGVQLLSEYIRIVVFYYDARIALRAARMHKSAAFLDAALCPCADLPTSEFRQAALSGTEELLKLMERIDVFDSRQAAEAFRHSPSDFERFAEDRAVICAQKAKYVTLGPEPLIGYLVAKEAELKAVHILLSGLRAGQEESAIRERLRMLYA